MFVSKEHHPQVLPRESYIDPTIYKKEIETILLPAWHCVAVMSELPRNGSFLTFDLFERPIILWRNEDEVSAFLNVCSHRYSKLTCKPCGIAERLHCQYHGWEYDETGNVRKIPDAKTFRPLAHGMLGLKRFRVERCGELVFVNLTEDGPSLKEFLGNKFELYESWFSPEMHTAIVMTRKINANWKCLVENALESYHTTEVHPKTFGKAPAEKDCTHQLHDTWTSLFVDYSEERSFRAMLDRIGHWMVGRQRDGSYEHILHYPNIMIARLSLYRWVECVVPVSPDQSLSVVRLMCHIGEKGQLRRLWNRGFISRWANDFLTKVGSEDAEILPHIQAGLAAADEPTGGLISTREERVFHFQNYIERASQMTGSDDVSEILPIRFSGNAT
ncbi:aromatic ring-hydroxylating oxygenase subunit alpha [Blastopirellula marina]|uniref:Putative dioxygenase alpha subunit yeaW n=1 Tax=Blastopirellula marina DSM 3645 TaxID=314230 RepID=A3ZWB2_9BACT|nr:aromatic ring-hydroxylating dioxygenase subunit alpha [Blastopirellula marina]EAQ79140.1 putative dioxygenase alpha subunit yeaW [Blastopirellula marina DSM 3645]